MKLAQTLFLIESYSRKILEKIKNMRGSLIILEGCDRAGKTSQCKNLVKSLMSSGLEAKYINFPDRSTNSGQLINAYLTNKQEFTDETIHLLFTLNRWEVKPQMEELLKSGTTLVVDRYSYSGVAYSAAKGLDFDWCKSPEAGLLKPDLVFFLTLSVEAMAKRGEFGNERYEIPEFQQRVLKQFRKMNDKSYWVDVNADKTEHDLQAELFSLTKEMIMKSGQKPLDCLW